MSDSTSWTIGRLLEWTANYLREHGSDTARLDAEVLLAKVRNCPRIELYTAYDTPATDEEREQFRELVRRRAAGTPVAYLVGEREFYALPFYVSPAVLIPRPETEFVVMRLLELARARPSDAPPRIVDLGTGSGVIAVCAAKHLPGAHVVAVDRSEQALAVARRNVERHGVGDAVQCVQGDWFEPLNEDRGFDFVVSNPPYISEAELAGVARDVRDFEPHEALVSADAGFADTRRIVEQAPRYLREGGWIILETSPMLAPRVTDCLTRAAAFTDVTVENDLARQPRVISARRCSPSRGNK